MTFGTMELIQTVTLSSSQASIDFQNIPQTYSDLVIKFSLRGDLASRVTYGMIDFNNSNANKTGRLLAGDGASAYSASYSDIFTGGTGANATASTFGNGDIYIPNYTGNTNKSVSIDWVGENNATGSDQWLYAGLWSNTSAINRITIHAADGSFARNRLWVANSTASLYGITRVPAGAKATGGVITDTDTHWIHTFTSSGTFTPSQNLTVEYLVIAGGGGGGGRNSPVAADPAKSGGSGGGGQATQLPGVPDSPGASGTPGEGNSGGNGLTWGFGGVAASGGGGGGAATPGGTQITIEPYAAGNGGNGISSSISGATVTYAAGGGGGGYTASAGIGGGGGAGGVRTGSGLSVTPGTTYTLAVGAGGGGGDNNNRGSNGTNSGIFATSSGGTLIYA